MDCANFLEVCKSWSDEFISQSAFFFDPPWGGYDYKKVNVINELYLDSEPDDNDTNADRTISLLHVLKGLLRRGASLIALKLPTNFNVEGYAEEITTWWAERKSCRVIFNLNYPSQYFFMIARRAGAKMKP